MSGIFDEYYDEYDLWYERNRLAYLSELEAVRAALPGRGRGLEVGVGTGRFASPLGIPYGIDPSFRMIKLAGERGVKVIVARGEEMPFRDDTFDYALIAITICFVENPERVIRETGRVLKDGGRIVVAIIDKDSFLGRAYQSKKSKFYREARFFSVDEVASLLYRCGFDDLSFLQTLFRFPNELEEVEGVEAGYGKGGFVVISARKMGR